jgi:hypothetical protein
MLDGTGTAAVLDGALSDRHGVDNDVRLEAVDLGVELAAAGDQDVGGVFGARAKIALVAILGGLASGRADGGIGGVVIAVSLVLISKRAVRGDERDRTLRRVAHRLIGRWWTQFVDADLTGTDASRCGVNGAALEGA